MLKMPRLVAMAGAALLALLIAGAALAQNSPPHTFWNWDEVGGSPTVTLDGEDAAGKLIVAWANGEQVGSATYGDADGWSIQVPGDTTGVTFTVDGQPAGETYDAPQGKSTQLTLAATSAMSDGDGDETMMGEDSGDDTLMGEDSGDDTLMGEDSGDDTSGDGMQVEVLDEDPPDDAMDGADDAMDGADDGMMDDNKGMAGDGDTVGGATGLPDTGTGGLADGSRGVSTAVYGGIAGALALIALVGGAAIRRRSQS